ncbi:hypothetical protein Bpfe_020169, partial [Biomphalaria pfeifferi]
PYSLSTAFHLTDLTLLLVRSLSFNRPHPMACPQPFISPYGLSTAIHLTDLTLWLVHSLSFHHMACLQPFI